jgi:hypothetical protein
LSVAQAVNLREMPKGTIVMHLTAQSDTLHWSSRNKPPASL